MLAAMPSLPAVFRTDYSTAALCTSSDRFFRNSLNVLSCNNFVGLGLELIYAWDTGMRYRSLGSLQAGRLPRMPRRLVTQRLGVELSDFERQDLFARQVRQVTTVAPLANLANVFSVCALLIYVVPSGQQTFRILWGTATLLVVLNSIRVWLPRVHRIKLWRSRKHSTRYDYWALMIEVILLGVLMIIFAAKLLPEIEGPRRMVLTATIAGLMGAGAVALSTVRSIGLVWILVHGGGLLLVLLPRGEIEYRYMAFQLTMYTIALCIGAIYLYQSFRTRCLAEFEAAAERETVGLLLDDFEGGSRDWLWEVGADGKMSHTSARLSQVSGISVSELRELTFRGLLERLDIASTKGGGQALGLLLAHLNGLLAFRDVVVPVRVDGVERWWSLSGNPLVSQDYSNLGWRGIGSDITEKYNYEQKILWLAATDALTGLPNRRAFSEKLDSALDTSGNGEDVHVAILDIDNFKSVNDTLGHSVGDKLLIAVAARLDAVADKSTCARIGGDEFGLILRTESSSTADERFRRYLESLRAPFHVNGNRIEVRATIGYASSPHDSVESDGLVMFADLALYEAKAAGRNRVGRFSSTLRTKAGERAAALQELGRAIERREFELHYQPQIHVATGRIEGFEALLRWNHPHRGTLAPGHFIDVAEETGLIVPLGVQVLEMACAAAMTWPDDLLVAVNVSPMQLASLGFGEEVARALAESGLSGSRLQLEITETGRVDDRAVAELVAFREKGISIALDDFGTGYSSFETVRRLPLDLLKIDRSFVAELDEDSAVVESLVEVSRSMGLRSLAEGVETVSQLDRLRAAGCDFVQGYYISRPLPASAVLSYVESSRATAGFPVSDPAGI